MKQCLSLLCLIMGLFLSVSWAWDERWTHAKSGRGDVFDDPDNSRGKAGTDPPQKFYKPNPRDFADVDPEEMHDYFDRYNKSYAPYALARIIQDLRYNNIVIPKGYYLIKPGDQQDGSPRVNMKTLNPIPTAQTTPVAQHPAELPALSDEGIEPAILQEKPGVAASTQSKNVSPEPKASSLKVDSDEAVYRVFVLKRQGKVAAVIPIHRMEVYKPPRKEKIPRHALAWVEMENRHPVLKFYYKKRLYSTDFQ